MPGADISVESLTWRPVRRREPVLSTLCLHIPAGQRVIVAGPSGAGKSTLLRAIAGLLLTSGQGDLDGAVLVGGRAPSDAPGRVGFLMQDPLAGIVAETVGRDVAFGLENLGVWRDEIWPRVTEALTQSGFPYGLQHPTSALSGGESQRLALAGSLVMGSNVVLLDEPTSMLDPIAAAAVRQAVRRDATTRGATTVIVEHHLEPWLDFADRVIVLGRAGDIIADGEPTPVLEQQGDFLAAEGVWVPGLGAPAPQSIDPEVVGPWEAGPPQLVRAEDVRVELKARLGGRRLAPTLALDHASATLVAGQVLAVTGPSGAGKSTLVAVLAGLLRPTTGQVTAAPELATKRGTHPWRWSSTDLAARLGWVPQIPEHGVVAKTVRDEVLASCRACGRDPHRAAERADALLDAFDLGRLAGASPYHLSGGEQRRLMVAAALAHGPCGVMLDEPTVGQDRRTWAAVVGALDSARSAGSGIAVATHDGLAVDVLADSVLPLSGGVSDGVSGGMSAGASDHPPGPAPSSAAGRTSRPVPGPVSPR
ncbi:MAG: ABC transporter ATP-binding protein [Nocardioidaceae bacterium]